MLTKPRSVKESAFLLTKYIRFFTSLTYPTELSDLVHKGTMLISKYILKSVEEAGSEFQELPTEHLKSVAFDTAQLNNKALYGKAFNFANAFLTQIHNIMAQSLIVKLVGQKLLRCKESMFCQDDLLPFFPRYVTKGLLRANGWFGLNSWR